MITHESPAPSFEDVWRMFQEIAQSFKETEQFMKSLSAETDRKFQETDRKFQETDRKFQETRQEIRQQSRETDRKIQETDRQIQETDRQIQETDRILKRVSKNLGDLGNRLGEFVEHMVTPALLRLFQAQGVDVHEVHSNVEAYRDGEGIEIDVLVVNDGDLVALECKSKLTLAHVDEHLARMEKLKRLLPAYRHHRALGAVAAMVVTESVKDYAIGQGLYVLYQSGENVEILSPEGFAPRVW